jgi:hypothetical protein
VCVCERVSLGVCACFVLVCERRESVCVCEFVFERVYMFECVRERVCVSMRVCICVCVRESCVCVYVFERVFIIERGCV